MGTGIPILQIILKVYFFSGMKSWFYLAEYFVGSDTNNEKIKCLVSRRHRSLKEEECDYKYTTRTQGASLSCLCGNRVGTLLTRVARKRRGLVPEC